MAAAVQTEQLSRRFGEITAVDRLNGRAVDALVMGGVLVILLAIAGRLYPRLAQ